MELYEIIISVLMPLIAGVFFIKLITFKRRVIISRPVKSILYHLAKNGHSIVFTYKGSVQDYGLTETERKKIHEFAKMLYENRLQYDIGDYTFRSVRTYIPNHGYGCGGLSITKKEDPRQQAFDALNKLMGTKFSAKIEIQP